MSNLELSIQKQNEFILKMFNDEKMPDDLKVKYEQEYNELYVKCTKTIQNKVYPSINEYLFIIYSENYETFKVYAPNEVEAKATLSYVCNKYSKTFNKDYQKFWSDIHTKLINGEYHMIQKLDFEGVVRVI